MKYDSKFSLVGNIKHLFKIEGASHDEQLYNVIALTKSEHDHLCTSLSELAHKNEQNVCELDAYRAGNHPDLKPQLSEIRYVLHGDIQPCSVLYSDDTTTLLRLDEGDVMCETDTIEWSDSVTYRCQELLKGESKRSNIPVTLSPVKLLAQLVRDERILLNDNGDGGLGADDAYFREEQSTAVVPAPPPFGHEKPDPNNPYMHTNDLFTEEAMRNHGWTTEALVSCGHGHYVPMQHPADTERDVASVEAYTLCAQCEMVFSTSLDLCPRCHTLKGPLPLTNEER
ncbi:hypothetical protein NVP1250O_90 [Vibrio phage 1.250.O._10N.261.55.E11]|nr:hypothetical protein NVP1250O_90 [Vibrio phage 1.250.O._10N.261.55.E11]